MSDTQPLWHLDGVENADPERDLLYYAINLTPHIGRNHPRKGWVGEGIVCSYSAVNRWCYLDDFLALELAAKKYVIANEYLHMIANTSYYDDHVGMALDAIDLMDEVK